MYSDRRGVIPLLQEIGVAEANGENRCLTGSYASAVKMCPKLAYCDVKSLQFQRLYRQSQSLNTTVTVVF